MDQTIRSSSAPLSGREQLDSYLAVTSDPANIHGKAKRTPRSPGFLNHEESIARLEFQDSKRGTEELRELARTTGPHPSTGEPDKAKALESVSRKSSSRRHGVSFKRILHLSRSATTTDLAHGPATRESIDVASCQSTGGCNYMKIAIDPRLYTAANASAYEINRKETKIKRGNTLKEGSSPTNRSGLEKSLDSFTGTRPLKLFGHRDHRDMTKKTPRSLLGTQAAEAPEIDICETGNGYSPSKGIPKPELGPSIRDFAAATLSIAQAHAGRQSSPDSKHIMVRQIQSPRRESLTTKHGKNNRVLKASFKGSYTVPVRLHIRAHPKSPLKTPRTSLDDVVGLNDTSPTINGATKASSTISAYDSMADDGQSDAYSGEIMNAQSAEFIQGQGALGYNSRSCKLPRPGPAPTRALPSLPEGSKGISPKSNPGDKTDADRSAAQRSSHNKPLENLPAKGHRYRLSPVKHNVSKLTPAPVSLKPSPDFEGEFPQPPKSYLHQDCQPSEPASQAYRIRKASPTLSQNLNRQVHVCELSASPSNGASKIKITIPGGRQAEQVAPDKGGPTSPGQTKSRQHGPSQRDYSSDGEQQSRAWTGSRVERVRALKARDLERLRPSTKKVISSEYESGNSGPHSHTEYPSTNHPDTNATYVNHDTLFTKKLNPSSKNGNNNAFSPIILVNEQVPSIVPLSIKHMCHLDHTKHRQFLPSPERRLPLQSPNYFPSLPEAPKSIHRAPSTSSTGPTHLNPSASARNSSSTNPTSDAESRLEARIAAMEKKCWLLERAFFAAIDASSGYGYGLPGQGPGMDAGSLVVGEEFRRGGSNRTSERLSGVSDVVAPFAARVQGMLAVMSAGGREKEGGKGGLEGD